MENQSFTGTETALAQEGLNLRHYWHVILERRWLVITAFVSILVLSVIYLFRAPRVYQAVARLQINREFENVLSLPNMYAIDGRDQDYLQTQYKNLESRALIEKIAEELNLRKDVRYKGSLDIARAIAQDITIAPIRLSRLVDIKLEHPQCEGAEVGHGPKMAATIANALVQRFLQENLDQKVRKTEAALAYLSEEARRLEAEVERADIAVYEYRLTNNVISLEESENIAVQALKQAQGELVKARTEAAIARDIAAKVEDMVKKGLKIDDIPDIGSNPLIQKIRNDAIQVKSELGRLLQDYLEKYPAVARARQNLKDLEESLEKESQSVYTSILTKAELTQSTVQSLQEAVERYAKDQFRLGQMRIGYEVLRGKAERSKALYTLVLQKQKEMELTKADKTQNMQVVYPAVAPFRPIKPRVTMILFLGIVGGVVVAAGLAFFVNYLDDSIKTQDDVEVYLRLPFLGYIPNIKTTNLVERCLHGHLQPRSNASEGFRTIRAAISLMPKSDRYRVLSVTSTIPSEGKSLVASNLAIVFAQTGLKTLLVDADLRRPSVHKAFELHSPVGLSSYLTGETNRVESLIRTTDVPNLEVVCSGAIPPNPSELLSSKAIHQFLEEMRNRYDRVILDCPPVSAVSDPLVLAARSDGVVFVTKFNKIRRQHARRTIQRIQDAGIHVLGVILNDIDFEGRDSYYYNYYYYQNRYYGHYRSEPDGKGTDGKATDGKGKPEVPKQKSPV